MSQEIRWQYRFANFRRAYVLLSEAFDDGVEVLNQLEREGVIQRFEYTFELAWLTLKDRLEYDGVNLTTVTPRNVIREAFWAKLVSDGDAWIDMLTDRNLMSHTYDFDRFEAVIGRISDSYLPMLSDLYERFNRDVLES
ncbi:MAG: nucleotidyltransferase substrate binding protein [Dehalococcoidia bacterium]|nr:nucleotidyltransferase substrate binding protein [Dehalococcoidia bacterium]